MTSTFTHCFLSPLTTGLTTTAHHIQHGHGENFPMIFCVYPQSPVGCSPRRIRPWRTSWMPPWTSVPRLTKSPKRSIKYPMRNMRTLTLLVVSRGLRRLRICLRLPLGCASSDRNGPPIRTNASSCGRCLPESRTLPGHSRQSAHPETRQRLLGLHGPRHRLSGDIWAVISGRCVLLAPARNHAFLTSHSYPVVRSASSHKILTVFGEVGGLPNHSCA